MEIQRDNIVLYYPASPSLLVLLYRHTPYVGGGEKNVGMYFPGLCLGGGGGKGGTWRRRRVCV